MTIKLKRNDGNYNVITQRVIYHQSHHVISSFLPIIDLVALEFQKSKREKDGGGGGVSTMMQNKRRRKVRDERGMLRFSSVTPLLGMTKFFRVS